MKSEVELELLNDYLEGDAAAEQELFARYDRELDVRPELWAGIENRIVPVGDQILPLWKSAVASWMGIAAGLVVTIGLLSVFLLSRTKEESIALVMLPQPPPVIVQRQERNEKAVTQIKGSASQFT